MPRGFGALYHAYEEEPLMALVGELLSRASSFS